jgi:hypothetical protein
MSVGHMVFDQNERNLLTGDDCCSILTKKHLNDKHFAELFDACLSLVSTAITFLTGVF